MLKGLISNLADTTLAATEPPLLAAAGTTTRATYRQRTANEFRETGHGLEWTIWRSGQDSGCFQSAGSIRPSTLDKISDQNHAQSYCREADQTCLGAFQILNSAHE